MVEVSANYIAMFIAKLWKMVNNEELVDVMCWNRSGKSFIIKNQVLFITKLLPMYFKHNNMGSFIRQLNLYDFHKICTDKTSELEYQHNYFQKDRFELLKYIKRKLPKDKRMVCSKMDRDQLANLSHELADVRSKLEEMGQQLNALQQENTMIMKELADLRNKHYTQNQVLTKLIEIVVPFMDGNNARFKNQIISQDIGPRIVEVPSGNDDFCNEPIEFRSNHNNNSLQVYSAQYPQPETPLSDSEHNFIDLKDLLDDIDSTSQDHSVKTTQQDLSYLNNDLDSLLNGDLLK